MKADLRNPDLLIKPTVVFLLPSIPSGSRSYLLSHSPLILSLCIFII